MYKTRHQPKREKMSSSSKNKSDGGLQLSAASGGKKRFKAKSVHDTYKKVSGVEHVLLRPHMYVGETQPISETWYVVRETQTSAKQPPKMRRASLQFSPAAFKLFDEIIVNAADHRARHPRDCTRMDVTVDAKSGEISIYNDGPGIPVVKHRKYNSIYIPRLIFGVLLTSSNYDDKEERVTGGRHGYGAKLTNIFSRHFKVETASRGRLYEKSWSKNMQRSHTEKITKYSGKDFTKITFIPDMSRFQTKQSSTTDAAGGSAEDGEQQPPKAVQQQHQHQHHHHKNSLPPGIVALMQRRTFDVAATCGLQVTWNGKRADHIASFLDYVLSFLPRKNTRIISSVDLTIPTGRRPKRDAGKSANNKEAWAGMSETEKMLHRAGMTAEEDDAIDCSSPSAPVAKSKSVISAHLAAAAAADGGAGAGAGAGGGADGDALSAGAAALTHSEEAIRQSIADRLPETRPDKDREVLVYHQRTKHYDVVLAFHMDGGVDKNDHISFVNNVATHNGGTHLKHVQDVVLDMINSFAGAGSKTKDLTRVLKSMMQVFVSATVPNPTFGSQIKDKLITPLADFKSHFRVHNLTRFAFRATNLATRIVTAAEREMGLAVAHQKMKGTRIFGRVNLPKLEDANWAGTKQSHLCTLILTEGDSAKALAVSGLAIVGRDRFGVFPLKGKLLNAREAALKRVAENDQLSDVMKAMGLRFGENYGETPELRYGRIMIMADQDHDGSHIKGLLMNFIHTFWPTLLNIDGFITQFVTPIVKALPVRSSDGNSRAFFALSDFQRWRAALSAAEARRYHFKYYKGLGTSTSAEGREYFSNIERHSIDMVRHNQPRQDDGALELAFASDMIEARKVWVSSHSTSEHVGVDFRRKKLTFFDFIHKELILYSVADCERSIPSFIDGLKPSQRKVMYGCFKRHLTRSMKVEALGGYIAEQTAYHHGEKSLHDTIINLAQDFVGANNLPLLVPDGQFGTRHEGGRDHASARYIFTHLNSLARLLFPAADDVLLRYKDDDGFPIEPYYYVPVIPLVLVNGASGIGTGFATNVPMFNPLDIIANVRRLLRGEVPEEMVPWHEGFTGTYEEAVDMDTGDTYYWTSNVVYFSGVEKVTISDLAPGITTSSVKQHVVKLVKDESIAGFTENHTPSTVHFDLDLSDEEPDPLVQKLMAEKEAAAAVGRGKEAAKEAKEKLARAQKEVAEAKASKHDVIVDLLAKSRFGKAVYRTHYMYGFDRTGTMRLFSTTAEVMEEHFAVRLKLYEDRFNHVQQVLEHQLEVETSRHRFLAAVCKGTLKLSTLRDEAALLAYMKRHKLTRHFPPAKSTSATALPGTTNIDVSEGLDPSTPALSGKSGGGSSSSSSTLTGYEYLLRIPISHFNKEHVLRSEDRMGKISAELAKHKAKTPDMLFREDLDALEAGVKDYYAKREQARREEKPPGSKKGGGGGGSSSSSLGGGGGGGGSSSSSSSSGGSGARMQMKSTKSAQKEVERLLSMVHPAEASVAAAVTPAGQTTKMLARACRNTNTNNCCWWVSAVMAPPVSVVALSSSSFFQQQQQHLPLRLWQSRPCFSNFVASGKTAVLGRRNAFAWKSFFKPRFVF